LHITPSYYWAGIVLYSISCAILGCVFIFLVTAFFGFYHKIRKDQDIKLIYILATMSLLSTLHTSLVVSSIVYETGMDCKSREWGATFLLFPAKALLFVFLARKASLVQYNANAVKAVFILDYVIIVMYVIYYCLIMFIPGVLNFSHFTDSSNGLGMCLLSAKGTLPTGSLVFEVTLNVLSLYLFLKPLYAHLRESRVMGQTMSGNSILLGNVIKRNCIGSAITITVTLATRVFAIEYFATITTDLGVQSINFGLVGVDECVAVICLMFLCSNAFEVPCLHRTPGTGGVTTNTSAGKSSENGNEIVGQA